MIDGDRADDAFLTEKELVAKFGIFERDLPRGSRLKHDDFVVELAAIEVTSKLIQATDWSHVRIVQSKQNCAKSGMGSGRNRKRKGNGKGGQRGVCGGSKICSRRFEQLAVESLERLQAEGTALTPIVHFKFRKTQYHLEKLLPVHIPGEGMVAVSFWFNRAANRVQASGVCLDLTDIRNKANLVRRPSEHEQWIKALDKDGRAATINNLAIEKCEKECNHRGQSAVPRSKNQRRKEKNKRKVKAPRHGGSRNATKSPSPPSSTSSVISSDSNSSSPNSSFSGRSGHSELSDFSGLCGVSGVSGHSVPRGQSAVWSAPVMAQQQPIAVQHAVAGDYGWFHQQTVGHMMPQPHYGGGSMNGGGAMMQQQPMYHGQGQGLGHFQQQHGHYGPNGWYQPPQSVYTMNAQRY